MLKHYIFLVLFFPFFINSITAQTNITTPDSNFEQVFIDLDIQSDEEINGQLLCHR